jgi:predicted HTH transcriptional regulator
MKIAFSEMHSGFLFKLGYTKQKTSLVENGVVDNVVDDVVDNVVDAISQKEQEIIRFISENKKITAKEMALKLDLTQRTVQRYLKSMQEKEMIKRVGTDNMGYWKINPRVE